MPLWDIDAKKITDGVVDALKELIVEYADNLLAVLIVMLFIWAGVMRLGSSAALGR